MAVALVAFITACGGDADDGPIGSRKLSSLSVDEQVELCEANSLTEAERDGGTKLACFLTLIGEQACTDEAVAACVAESEPAPQDCAVPSASEQAAFAACDATVDELNACLDAYRAILQAFGNDTCETAQTHLEEVTATPAACQAIEAACPNLFADDAP